MTIRKREGRAHLPVPMRRPAFLALITVVLSSCAVAPSQVSDLRLVDPDATEETRALFLNMQRLAPDYLMFGHQDALAYGVGWEREPGRSDVKDVTGSHPAVFGWELGDLETGAKENLDGVNFREMQGWIIDGYEQGGVVTIGWHMDNPVSGGSAWDTTRAVYAILPGGEQHEKFVGWLDMFADFVAGLVSEKGGTAHPVPFLFRPYHEHSGSWFWWGGENVTPEEYKELWRFTVQYLRDDKGLHNMLYSYATDVFDSDSVYMLHYPGDEWVDIFGYDDYRALRSEETLPDMTRRLSMLVEMAESRGKIPALTETGGMGVGVPDWFTGRLLRAIQASPVSRRISYALVWRNEGERQYFAPYEGHPAAPDFVEFYKDPFVLFLDELPDMYATNKN